MTVAIVQEKFPPYLGPEWERKVNDPSHPNFWKYGVADQIFLDFVIDRRTVLDVGCGTGGSTLFLADNSDTDLMVGVDVVDTMIRVAKEKARRKECVHRVEFVICDGRQLPFKGSSFEALVSRGDVLPWLIPQDRALHEFNRVMKQGAVIVVEIDNTGRLMKVGTTYTYFEKTSNGKISYVLNTIDTNRNHVSTYYILRMGGDLASRLSQIEEFARTGHYPADGYSLEEIRKETIEIRQGLPTHWHTPKELGRIFVSCGFKRIEVLGDGLFMKLLLQGDEEIAKFIKEHAELVFKIEKRLSRFVNPDKAPTVIIKGVKS